jgi:hypothetical protein
MYRWEVDFAFRKYGKYRKFAQLAPAGGSQDRVVGDRGQLQFLEPCSDALAQTLIWYSGLFGDAVRIKNLDGI